MKNIPNRIYLQVDSENEKPEDFNKLGEVSWCADKIYDTDIPYYRHKNSNQVDLLVSVILADFGNLLIDIMGSRKCSIGSLENYYDLHLEVKRISELYSKLQEYFTVSQNSR